jgi:hypothetical protein
VFNHRPDPEFIVLIEPIASIIQAGIATAGGRLRDSLPKSR